MICRSKKYSICRPNKYLWIKELSADRTLICRLKKYLICRLKNYLQIVELSTNRGSIWSASRRGICGSKNYLQLRVWSLDWKIIWFADYMPTDELQIKEGFNLQMEELYEDQRNTEADQRTIFHLEVEELFANRWAICRSKNYVCRSKNCLQIEELFADQMITPLVDWRMICRSKKYLISRLKKYL